MGFCYMSQIFPGNEICDDNEVVPHIFGQEVWRKAIFLGVKLLVNPCYWV